VQSINPMSLGPLVKAGLSTKGATVKLSSFFVNSASSPIWALTSVDKTGLVSFLMSPGRISKITSVGENFLSQTSNCL
jgi:hypothetical protein